MAKYEIDTDKGTVKKINNNEGFLFLIVLFAIFAFVGGNQPEKEIDYWNGDINCPIFTERADGSMVVFKRDSVKELVPDYSSSNKVILFTGYEIDPSGNFTEYGYYGVFYKDSGDYYEVIYPKTAKFPEGERFTISNEYQINVCKVLIKAAAEHEKLKINN